MDRKGLHRETRLSQPQNRSPRFLDRHRSLSSLCLALYSVLNLWLPADNSKDRLKLWDRDVVEFFLGDDWTEHPPLSRIRNRSHRRLGRPRHRSRSRHLRRRMEFRIAASGPHRRSEAHLVRRRTRSAEIRQRPARKDLAPSGAPISIASTDSAKIRSVISCAGSRPASSIATPITFRKILAPLIFARKPSPRIRRNKPHARRIRMITRNGSIVAHS